jgi:hypothetical protein
MAGNNNVILKSVGPFSAKVEYLTKMPKIEGTVREIMSEQNAI